MKIAIVFEREYEHTMGTYFERALRSFDFAVDHFEAHDAEKVPADYDLYFRVDDSHLDYILPKRLKPQILFASDLHIPAIARKVEKQLNRYALILTPVRRESDRLKRKGVPVEWFNIGCDPEIHFPRQKEKIYDIGFVGNDGGEPRKFILQALAERYPKSFFGHVDYRELSQIYSASKIGFNYAIRGEYFQMRGYEIMASGTMLLMHALPDDSIKRLGFVEGKHLVLFRAMDEMFEAIDYYLNHEEEREKIAQAGYAEVISHHAYKHRMQHLLELVRDHLNLPIEVPAVEGYIPLTLR